MIDSSKLRTGLSVTELATGVLPGIPGGNAISFGANVLGTNMDLEAERKQVKEGLRVQHLHKFASHSKLVREYLKLRDGAMIRNIARFGTTTVGGAVGGAIAGSMIPIPIVGTAVGAIAGSMGANSLQDAVCGAEETDNAVIRMAQIGQMQLAGQSVSEADVFLALVYRLKPKAKKEVMQRLDRIPENRNNARNAAIMAYSKEYDKSLQPLAQILLHEKHKAYDPNRTASSQIADLINSKELDPVELLSNLGSARSVSRAHSYTHRGYEKHIHDIGHIAGRMRDMGIENAEPINDENGTQQSLPFVRPRSLQLS